MRSFALAALSAGFVAIGLLLIGVFGDFASESRRFPEWVAPVAGWLSIVFFGPLTFVHLWAGLNPRLAVRITDQGMFLRNFSAETIPWADAQELRSLNIMGTSMLQFEVTDERMEHFGWFRRKSAEINRSTSGLAHSIVVNNTNRSHAELLEAVLSLAPPQLTRYL
ncbi:STM3941 family protein [Erythrobacter crassostreae]|uniref:PH domain-containing protein n=1 Tax=Erythrobacter crassostreae TaxID=2828328 RepID=A0A9X1JN40_9SPHN|nr:STM3941 family protein [Erythrobacter crassostrea]MBV7260079.1 hypothetical protein [Erythrobacter crassostrea]